MRTVVKSPKKTYRSLLLKKRDEILAATRSEPEALSANVQSPDAVEFAVRTVEQDVTVVTANLRSGMLKEIERALARCAGGTYGVCEACGEDISPNRLKAIPGHGIASPVRNCARGIKGFVSKNMGHDDFAERATSRQGASWPL